MLHGPQQNTRTSLLLAMLACSVVSAAAQAGAQQTSLQQAMLRSAPPSTTTSDEAAPAPSSSVASALQQIAAQAAVVFTGSVVTVAADGSGGAEVKFSVDRGVRGIASGAAYTMRVSAWAGGAERYYPGERALFLLTAPSISGYSAPVMGERGIVPMTGDALVGNLDLRWIATDMLRGVQAQPESIALGAQLRSAAVAGDMTPAPDACQEQSAGTTNCSGSLAMPDVHAIDRDLVLDLLRASDTATGQTR